MCITQKNNSEVHQIKNKDHSYQKSEIQWKKNRKELTLVKEVSTLSLERCGIEVENPTFALEIRFALSPEVGLKFPTEDGSGTGMLLGVLSKERSVLLFLHLKFGADLCQPFISPGEDGKHGFHSCFPKYLTL